MGVIVNGFNGKLNLDTQYFRITGGDYTDALNITRDSPGEGSDVVVTNVVGNTEISYTLPTGTNKVIGTFADRIRNRIYCFIWNSFNLDTILYYNRDNGTIVKLIENITDTDGDILEFDPSYRINHIDIVYRDQQGDLLCWVAGNSTPKKINVQTIEDGTYGTIELPFIQVAKSPPLAPPTGQYGSDSARNSNALRRTLFQFTLRWQYDDYEKSSFSTYSKIFLPIGFYGSDNDIDNTKNNFITITVPTGKKNVIALEIGMRYNIGNNWSDIVQIAFLTKDQLGIPNDTDYQFLFYNDGVYPPIADGVQYVDGVQVIPLFDWVPQSAYCQALANGNVLTYEAITENYNNYPVGQLRVTMTAANVTNNPPDTDPPSLTYTGGGPGGGFTFTVSGTVPTGTFYRVIAFIQSSGATIILAQYTSLMGDNINTVATGLFNSVLPSYSAGLFVPSFSVLLGGTGGSSIVTVTVIAGSGGGGGTISTEKTWLWNATYIYGIVYVDDQNRDMPGVTTFINPVNSDNDFSVTTPPFSQSGGSAQTPVISASINHLPPAGAVKYYWVRRRQTYGNFLQYETCDFQQDSDYLYFCLDNVDQYHTDNNQFIYGTAPITPNSSRIQIMAGITGSAYDGNIYNQDYQIQGTVIRTLTGGSSPDDDKTFIKVAKPAGAISPAYQANMLVMVYTPIANPTSIADSVYYEWGEAYDIYEDSGVMYHAGMDQNQTAVQAATFTWEEGDVYFHQRVMYNNLTLGPPIPSDTVSIMDANFSDFFNSAVNDNGRAQAIEVNAQQIYNPVLIRFGGEFQSGTTVNNLNTFLFENQQEADRSRGDIRKVFIRNRYMYVIQKFKIGIIPILLQIVRDTAGNPLEANSDILLNKINYPYNEDIGIGDIPESFASDKEAMYGADNYRGVVWRLSQDGITVLSVTYETNSFFASKLPAYRKSLNNGYAAPGQVYAGDPTVIGVFDGFTNKYIICLEEINRYNSQNYLTFHQDAATLSFNEVRTPMEGFESFLSYHPENMVCLDILLIACKDGKMWIFSDAALRCNFFGVQYNSSITTVVNDAQIEKKSWQSITEYADDIWECPEIYGNVNTYSNQKQQTKLIPQNFRVLEGNPSSAILRDSNSRGGIINGDQIKGNYLVIKLLRQNPTSLVYLNAILVKFADSPLTITK